MGPCLVPRLFHSSFCWLSLPRSPSFHRPLLLLSLLLLNAGLPPLLLRRTHAPTHPPTRSATSETGCCPPPLLPKKAVGEKRGPRTYTAARCWPSSSLLQFPFLSPSRKREREPPRSSSSCRQAFLSLGACIEEGKRRRRREVPPRLSPPLAPLPLPPFGRGSDRARLRLKSTWARWSIAEAKERAARGK